ncbi:MAG TPA: hypothetical protein VLV81_10940 [Acidimicrobiia bacterium]|nr:hypothetical protein [Acidimicrobiia bacterium]
MDGSVPAMPVVCSLDAVGGRAQLDRWAALRTLHQGTEPVPNGVRLWFAAAAADAVRAAAVTEAACCAFLRLSAVEDTGRVRLDITSEIPGARPVIDLLAATASGDAPG